MSYSDLTDKLDAAIASWPMPRPIESELPPAPAFDGETLLPKIMRDFVLDEADRMPCPPDFVAAALIVALGSVIGAKVALKPKKRDDWIVTPNLFGGVVGAPSSKKSPSIGPVMRFLDKLEAAENDLLKEKLIIHTAELAAFEARQSAIKTEMKKAAVSSMNSIDKMSTAVYDLQTLEAPHEPTARRFKSNDATVSKLGDILAKQNYGMLIFRDELVGLLSSWDRDGNEGDRAFYLEGWNGTSSFQIDRIGRGSLSIQNLCLSVFGGIQPDLMQRYLSDLQNSLDNDGRVQRFQVMVYPDAVNWEWRDRYPVHGAREAVRDIFVRLASFDPVQDGASPATDFAKLPAFRFDDDAQEVFIDWSSDLHVNQIASEENPLMQQHLAKFEKLFCSIALILHLAEGRIGPVTLDNALRAAAWCEYLAGHARRIYGLVDNQKTSTAKTIARRMREGKLQSEFTARDVLRKGWTGIRSTSDAESALLILEEHAWINAIESSDSAGGRPTVKYLINPRICEART